MNADLEGFWYMKRRNMASIADVGGRRFLDVKLHQGCVGTEESKGCGFMGILPLNDQGSPEVATLEYSCAPLNPDQGLGSLES
jgi:hypothetical protein